jgi:adenylate kinase
MIVVLLGPPGSGKGTQAKRIVSEKKWPHLSTGDMLRAAIKSGSEVGVQAKKFIDQGMLVPDDLVVNLIGDRMKASDCQDGFVLDGFPRNVPQAVVLDQMLAAQGKSVGRVILFDMTDESLVKRLSGRRTCSQCASMYHIETLRSVREGICDHCGSSLIQRSDDQVDVIKNRLQVYHQQTEPLIQFYREQMKLVSLDAHQAAGDVHRSLVRALG